MKKVKKKKLLGLVFISVFLFVLFFVILGVYFYKQEIEITKEINALLQYRPEEELDYICDEENKNKFIYEYEKVNTNRTIVNRTEIEGIATEKTFGGFLLNVSLQDKSQITDLVEDVIYSHPLLNEALWHKTAIDKARYSVDKWANRGVEPMMTEEDLSVVYLVEINVEKIVSLTYKTVKVEVLQTIDSSEFEGVGESETYIYLKKVKGEWKVYGKKNMY